ncbi:MAG: magnesium-translocating P-type ATPase [Patescibacteria group bacterium]
MDFSSYATKTVTKTAAELTTSIRGLANDETLRRRQQYGFNEIASAEPMWWHILRRQFTSPFIYLLIGAALLSFFLDEAINGILILLFVLLNAGLGFYQEYHSEKTLKLLKQYVTLKVKVRREGAEAVVLSRELVPGDVIIVEAGDIIPADIRFFKDNDLLINESVLTGESIHVSKSSEPLNKPIRELYKASNIGFSGTTVASGRGEGYVFAIGRETAMGAISRLSTETVRTSTFEKGIRKVSSFILRLILVTLVFVFIANIAIKGGSANVIEMVVFSVALAVSVIPEALPIVTTFSLSRGALHLAKNKVVVKRLSAIEDLGGIEVLCSDKTGTLTENKLKVERVKTPDPHAGGERSAIRYASLASEFFTEKLTGKNPNNAFDLALLNELSAEEKKSLNAYAMVNEVPFDPQRRRNSVLVQRNDAHELIVRGAPEAVLPYCAGLSAQQTGEFNAWIANEGAAGCRVLAIAHKKFGAQHEYTTNQEERGLSLDGIISFADPIKESTKQTITRALRLGVQLKILTGDSKEVAGAVAQKVGLITDPKDVITGDQFQAMPDLRQQKAVGQHAVFARISPEQKFRIIELLKQKFEVGFLGEGINDAPALKSANVGLVVQGASDIAREASDVILLEKSLGVIIDGITEGRKVFANTIKYIKATLASNFGNFFAVAIASLLIDFLPMLPLQILLLNLLSDFPMIAIAADTVDTNELKKPRNYNIREIALLALVLGIVSTVFDFIFFAIFYRIGPSVLQTNWFIGSILTELALLFSIRTKFFCLRARRPARPLLWLSVVAAVVAIALPATGIGQSLFKFTAPHMHDILLIVGIVVCYFVITETVKLFYYRTFEPKNAQLKRA